MFCFVPELNLSYCRDCLCLLARTQLVFLKYVPCNFSKFYFPGTGDVDSSILNKGNNDDFLGSSAGKKIVFVSCGVYLFVFF